MHDLWSPGGVATYLRRITDAQRKIGHEPVFFDSASDDGDAVRVSDGADLVASARRLGVEVVHLHLDPPGGFPGGVPAVRTVHGHQPYCPSGSQYLERRGRPCERPHSYLGCTWGHLVDRCGSARPLRLIDDFRRTAAERRAPETVPLIAISEFVRGRLLREGFRPDRIRVLTNPAPLAEAAGPFGDQPRFVFLGRLVPLKGPSWLVEAAAESERRWRVDIAGSGYAEPELRSLVARRGLAERVAFHGWLEGPALSELVGAAWAVVVPSLWHEPAGMSAIEAGALGRAVVASDAGGLPEVVGDGVSGRIVAAGDVAGLADALDRLSEDPAAAAEMGRAAAERVRRHHSLARHVEALDDAYRVAIRG